MAGDWRVFFVSVSMESVSVGSMGFITVSQSQSGTFLTQHLAHTQYEQSKGLPKKFERFYSAKPGVLTASTSVHYIGLKKKKITGPVQIQDKGIPRL